MCPKTMSEQPEQHIHGRTTDKICEDGGQMCLHVFVNRLTVELSHTRRDPDSFPMELPIARHYYARHL